MNTLNKTEPAISQYRMYVFVFKKPYFYLFSPLVQFELFVWVRIYKTSEWQNWKILKIEEQMSEKQHDKDFSLLDLDFELVYFLVHVYFIVECALLE